MLCSESGIVEEAVQNEDGFFTRKLPAELLKDINIVDTPGTNVIVDRQQRLTEEYVPRADLVLFCMSAGMTDTAEINTVYSPLSGGGRFPKLQVT